MSLTKDVKFGPDWILHVDVSVKLSHFLLQQVAAMIIMQCWPLDVVSGQDSLIKPVSLGQNRTFYGLVTTTSIPMARHRTLSRPQGHTL